MRELEIKARTKIHYKHDIDLVCENCGNPARVISIYGEHDEFYCADCYIEQILKPVDIECGEKTDFSEVIVGESYCVESLRDSEMLARRRARLCV